MQLGFRFASFSLALSLALSAFACGDDGGTTGDELTDEERREIMAQFTELTVELLFVRTVGRIIQSGGRVFPSSEDAQRICTVPDSAELTSTGMPPEAPFGIVVDLDGCRDQGGSRVRPPFVGTVSFTAPVDIDGGMIAGQLDVQVSEDGLWSPAWTDGECQIDGTWTAALIASEFTDDEVTLETTLDCGRLSVTNTSTL